MESLKILNSGIILKNFTDESVDALNPLYYVCLFGLMQICPSQQLWSCPDSQFT